MGRLFSNGWRCGESNSGPRMSLRASLRRVGYVEISDRIIKRILTDAILHPLFSSAFRPAQIDPIEDIARMLRYRIRGIRTSQGQRRAKSSSLTQKRTQGRYSSRRMVTLRVQQICLHVRVTRVLTWSASVHGVARLSKGKPSKPVTPRLQISQEIDLQPGSGLHMHNVRVLNCRERAWCALAPVEG